MRLVILDRDGVINRESDAFIKTPEEWEPLPGSLEAIARLYKSGYTVVVASNQSGVGRHLFSLDTLAAIHGRMKREVEAAGGKIDSIFFCPHTPGDGCDCRKPKPGLLHQIAERYQLSLKGVPMIGDSARDLAAARAVGGRAILVRTGNGLKALEEEHDEIEDYADLAAAVSQLLKEIH
ncbi:MAG TPA: D-glycero-beta-D-manno-heptose 1,7-bisphosphate 7-phosphatase [Gammaproteobacteria bacterium]|jgi:D-glycero-D-manno-heptose 1,7-bisphosphate phosphatase|nr:D-glycero-beta-D-manno-heptose 1,7-bisphosphate 7-phosphatase [Gammaproteobacteria bacterium]